MNAQAQLKGGTGRARARVSAVAAAPRSKRLRVLQIPTEASDAEVVIEGKKVRLTNLKKLFWPDLGITKGDLIQFYADVSEYLLPHLQHRAMVMKRYPGGAYGEFFFQ